MNIDEFKNTWNEDIVEETPEISLEQRNKLSLPLEKIRKNMRVEFWWRGCFLNCVRLEIS